MQMTWHSKKDATSINNKLRLKEYYEASPKCGKYPTINLNQAV